MQAQRSIICERIRDRLEDIGWSPIDLAVAVRVSEKSVYRWVAGEYAPRSEYLVSIARAFDVSPLWLLGVSDDSGPMSADVALRARRVATGDEVVAALEDALARAKARVGGGDDDAAPEGAASV